MTKDIWIIIAVFVVITAVASMIIQNNRASITADRVVPNQTNTMIMKCGAGKCGAAMMEEIKEKNPSKNVIMKCGAGKCGSAMSSESK